MLLKGTTGGEVHFPTTPQPLAVTPFFFWRLFSRRAFHHHVQRRAFCACWETALGTGWSAAGDSRSAATYRACLWLRGETTVWMCGRMDR